MESSEKLKQAVKEYKQGNAEAFTILYNESNKYIYTCIYKVMSGNDNAQDSVNDIMQDTYVEISKYILQLEEEEKFLSWAGTIATRKCYAYLKKNHKYVLLTEEDTTFEQLSDDDNIIPEEVMQDREKQRLLRQIIENELSEMQKLCIIAFYYNEQKRSEIARELGIPENTVKTNLARAKAKIKEGVLELEKKQGTRLYSVAPLLLLWLKEEAETAMVPEGMLQGILSKASLLETVSDAGTATTSVTSATSVSNGTANSIFAKFATVSLKTKIGAGMISLGIIGGISGGVYVASQTQEVIVAELESEDEIENKIDDRMEGTIENDLVTSAPEKEPEMTTEAGTEKKTKDSLSSNEEEKENPEVNETENEKNIEVAYTELPEDAEECVAIKKYLRRMSKKWEVYEVTLTNHEGEIVTVDFEIPEYMDDYEGDSYLIYAFEGTDFKKVPCDQKENQVSFEAEKSGVYALVKYDSNVIFYDEFVEHSDLIEEEVRYVEKVMYTVQETEVLDIYIYGYEIGRLPANQRVEVNCSMMDWACIYFEEEMGWIPLSALSDVQE